MKVSLKNIIVPSIPLAIVLVISCFVIWMSTFFGGRVGILPVQNSFAVNYLQSFIQPDTLFSNLIGVGFTLLNAFLIAQINNRFTIIKTRTFLPLLIFLLLVGTWNETHIVNGSHISLTLFILSLFYFLNMYRNKKASEMAFMGSLLIGIASIIINPLIFLIPVFWIGFVIFQSLSLRTFLATLFGILAPWIIYLSGLYYFNQQIEFQQLLSANFNLNLGDLNLSISRIIYFSSILLILIITLIGMFSITNSDAIRTRNNLNFFILLLISIGILSIVFQNQLPSFLPIIALLYSFLASYAFTLKTNNFYGILFIVFVVINLLYVISKYIFI
ncbi:MAG: DUF6427 family protein [Paludibacter sp.]|nr:DUF6427 family protein [Paludibacter sp.]